MRNQKIVTKFVVHNSIPMTQGDYHVISRYDITPACYVIQSYERLFRKLRTLCHLWSCLVFPVCTLAHQTHWYPRQKLEKAYHCGCFDPVQPMHHVHCLISVKISITTRWRSHHVLRASSIHNRIHILPIKMPGRSRVLIQYKYIVLPVQGFPLWRWDDHKIIWFL